MKNFDPLSPQEDNEPYVGMPIGLLSRGHIEKTSACNGVDNCPLAMAYVPWQAWAQTYEPAVGFERGTIFPELDLPWEVR